MKLVLDLATLKGHTHIKNSVIMSFKYKLFKEMFKMSSAAAQKASTKPPMMFRRKFMH